MFKTIIAGLDGSEESLKALLHAKSLTEKYGADLILLHAYPHTSDLHDCEGYDALLAMRKSKGEKILDEGLKLFADTSTHVEKDLLEGPASNALINAAQTRNADLIVMGTRGMGTVKGLLFGSVAAKVSQNSPCPVMVVP